MFEVVGKCRDYKRRIFNKLNQSCVDKYLSQEQLYRFCQKNTCHRFYLLTGDDQLQMDCLMDNSGLNSYDSVV